LPRVKVVLCKQSMDDNSPVGCLLYEYKDLTSGTALEYATRKIKICLFTRQNRQGIQLNFKF